MEQRRQKTEEETDESQQRQEIWSWGAGTDGQLATAILQDEHSPQLLRSLSVDAPPITSLSCGGAHVIAVTSGGRVLTWGRGSSGQLGHGEMVNVLQPKMVKDFEGSVITHVSAGWNHSGFVSDSGAIFTCGDGSFGQLGHGDYKSKCSPLEVVYFGFMHVAQVACGMRHSLVLLGGNAENRVYGFGSGKRGQLGISTEKIKSTTLPQITMGLTNLKIISISANGDHSAALSGELDNKHLHEFIFDLESDLLSCLLSDKLDDGSLYTWGRGFGRASDACVPRLFDASFSLDQIALGWNHALLLTSEGELFMLGGDRHGVLGDSQKTYLTRDLSEKSKESIARIIPDLMDSKVLQIAAGAEHSALVTENGSIMTWGWGEHGQLGLGDTNDQTAPRVVTLGCKLDEKPAISRVYCGSGFLFVLRT